MAFTVTDFEDLARLLSEHAEWRTRLRPLILGEEVLQIPSRMDRVEATLDRMATAQDEARSEMAALRDATQKNTDQIASLAQETGRLAGRIAQLDGGVLELRYANQTTPWFGRWLRRVHRLTELELNDLYDALEAAGVDAHEIDAIHSLDLLVRGIDKATGDEVLLAVEVSYTVNVDDVERALARASILQAAGLPARPATGGYRATEAAVALAQQKGVIVDMRRPPD